MRHYKELAGRIDDNLIAVGLLESLAPFACAAVYWDPNL